jgi:STE24 endopeptidase
MSPNSILIIILTITAAGYLFEQLLDYINLRAQKTDIPDDVASFYDSEKYLKSLAYHRERTNFSFLTSAVGFIISFSMLYAGGFGWIDTTLANIVSHEILKALLFFGVIMLASDILTIPFQLYSTFVIEERYGFNKTTMKLFISDKLKGYLLAAVIGGSLLAVLLFLIKLLGQDFWIWFSFIAAAFILLVNMFYTSVIIPLFNTLTPLPDGSLKDAIQEFALKVKFPLDNIYVIDGSKRSSKANAFFSGIGKRKKIVLYDTLIANHTTDQLVAILAHEVGHFKRKHIVVSYFLSIIQVIFTLFVLSVLVFSENVSLALGGNHLSIPLNLIAFGILFSPVSAVTGLLMNIISRRNEFEADDYARQTYSGSALSEALKKLSVENLSNLYPHPLFVFFHYSHPPLLRRLAAIRSAGQQ